MSHRQDDSADHHSPCQITPRHWTSGAHEAIANCPSLLYCLYSIPNHWHDIPVGDCSDVNATGWLPHHDQHLHGVWVDETVRI